MTLLNCVQTFHSVPSVVEWDDEVMVREPIFYDSSLDFAAERSKVIHRLAGCLPAHFEPKKTTVRSDLRFFLDRRAAGCWHTDRLPRAIHDGKLDFQTLRFHLEGPIIYCASFVHGDNASTEFLACKQNLPDDIFPSDRRSITPFRFNRGIEEYIAANPRNFSVIRRPKHHLACHDHGTVHRIGPSVPGIRRVITIESSPDRPRVPNNNVYNLRQCLGESASVIEGVIRSGFDHFLHLSDPSQKPAVIKYLLRELKSPFS